MDHAHDVVHRLLVDGQAGIAALGKEGGDLLLTAALLRCHQVHPGSENLPHLQVVELDGRPDQLALVLVQSSLVLRLVHHGHQLLFRDSVGLRAAEHPGQQLLPLAEQEVQGRKHHHEQPQQGGGKHSEFLRGLLGQTFGGYLSKNQNDNGQGHGGHGGAVLVEQVGTQHSGNGCRGDVDNVVADQNGGQQLAEK